MDPLHWEVCMKLVERPGKSKDKKDAHAKDESSDVSGVVGRANHEVIKKFPVDPNLKDYERAYASFDWDEAKKELAWFAGGKINAAFNAVDRHLHDGRRNKVALYAISADNRVEKWTFQEIYEASNRMGNALKELGVKKGDRVFVFLPRVPELYIATIAIAKIGAIAGPLFSAFGPDALRDRLQDSEAKIIVTTPALKPKLDEVRADLPDLQNVIVVGATHQSLNAAAGELSYQELMDAASDRLECAQMDPEDPLYLLYTSGTTGKPKGVVHVHNDLLGHPMTSKWVLDLRDDDIY